MIGRYVGGCAGILFITFVAWSIALFIAIFGYKFFTDIMAGWENPDDQILIRLGVGSFLVILDIVLVIGLFVMIGDSRERRQKQKRSLEDRIEELESELKQTRGVDCMDAPPGRIGTNRGD
jgi:hypothetical protein